MNTNNETMNPATEEKATATSKARNVLYKAAIWTATTAAIVYAYILLFSIPAL